MKFTPITLAALVLSVPPLLGNDRMSAPATRSAHLSSETQPAYLDSIRQRIVINALERDPFGLPQDPKAPAPGDFIPRPPVAPPVSLAKVLEPMKITAINPTDHTFLVGARWFHQGETFPFLDGDRELEVNVESVGAESVVFRDLKSDETARISVEIAPIARPKPGADAPLPPGIERARPKGDRGAPFRP